MKQTRHGNFVETSSTIWMAKCYKINIKDALHEDSGGFKMLSEKLEELPDDELDELEEDIERVEEIIEKKVKSKGRKRRSRGPYRKAWLGGKMVKF